MITNINNNMINDEYVFINPEDTKQLDTPITLEGDKYQRTDFSVKIPQLNPKVNCFQIQSVDFVNTIYNIDDTNNVILLRIYELTDPTTPLTEYKNGKFYDYEKNACFNKNFSKKSIYGGTYTLNNKTLENFVVPITIPKGQYDINVLLTRINYIIKDNIWLAIESAGGNPSIHPLYLNPPKVKYLKSYDCKRVYIPNTDPFEYEYESNSTIVPYLADEGWLVDNYTNSIPKRVILYRTVPKTDTRWFGFSLISPSYGTDYVDYKNNLSHLRWTTDKKNPFYLLGYLYIKSYYYSSVMIPILDPEDWQTLIGYTYVLVPDGTFNMYLHEFVYLCSKQLSKADVKFTFGPPNSILKIPVCNYPFGTFIHWVPENHVFGYRGKEKGSFDFILTDSQGEKIDLNEGKLTLVLKMMDDKNKVLIN